jgi:hypothetical protein
LIGHESQGDDHSGIPFIVGIAGHRDLNPQGLPHIRAAVADHLRQLQGRLRGTDLRLMTGLAAGSDQLVAQVALGLGIAVDAVLPMPLKQYAEDFDAQSLATLEALIRHPKVRCSELPPPVPGQATAASARLSHRDSLYFNLAQKLTRNCALLIAIWDGKSPALPAGTTDTVLRFLGVCADRTVQEETRPWRFTDAPAQEDPPLRLVFWIPAARTGRQAAIDPRPPCFLSGLGENVLQCWKKMPSQLR